MTDLRVEFSWSTMLTKICQSGFKWLKTIRNDVLNDVWWKLAIWNPFKKFSSTSSITRIPRVNRSFCSISHNTDRNGKFIVGYHLKLHFWGPRLNFEPSQLCWDNFAIYGVLGVRVAEKGSYNVRNETNCISFFSLGQNLRLTGFLLNWEQRHQRFSHAMKIYVNGSHISVVHGTEKNWVVFWPLGKKSTLVL